MAVVPALPGGGFTDLFTNRVFLAGFWAWFCAQTLKVRMNAAGAAMQQQ
jgi:acid phosphatase family membrane protein YuiD